MRKKRRRRSKKIWRFPRVKIPAHLKQTERILRITYNLFARRKDIRKRMFSHFDIYKGRMGPRARICFITLAQRLLNGNIDPALYIKIMSRYGRYKNSTWMPHPRWLARKSTVKKFAWVYRKERKSYELKLDFKRAMNVWSDLDIYASIRDSAVMFRDAVEKAGLTEEEAMVVLRKELSPWYLSVSLIAASDKKDFIACLDFLRKNAYVRKMALKALKKN